MRRSLAGVSAAVTALVALAFLVPLTLLVGSVVRDRALNQAFAAAASVAPVLAVTTDQATLTEVLSGLPSGNAVRTSVYLPATGAATATGAAAEARIGARIGPGGTRETDVLAVMRSGRPGTAPVGDGAAALQPVALPRGGTAVVEVDVPAATLRYGVVRARLLLAGLAVLLVAGSVLVADRLAGRVVRAARRLSTASARLGRGDLDIRLDPEGPPELRQAAQAFNAMADRVAAMVAAERELAADLSHRLRTPLAGLLLAGRTLGTGPEGDRVRALTERLQDEVDAIIREARAGRERAAATRPGSDGSAFGGSGFGGSAFGGAGFGRSGSGGCEAVAVLRERLDFWGALAEDQDRRWVLRVPPAPVPLPVGAGELAAAVDALVGNVFLHTPDGAGFAVGLQPGPGATCLVVSDEGEGIADPQAALQRGASSAGSSGLGLDIVARVVGGCGGALHIGRTDRGGARITLTFPAAAAPPLTTA